jgi:hypothetical protein
MTVQVCGDSNHRCSLRSLLLLMAEQAEAALRKQRKQAKEEFTDADTAALDNVSTFNLLYIG